MLDLLSFLKEINFYSKKSLGRVTLR